MHPPNRRLSEYFIIVLFGLAAEIYNRELVIKINKKRGAFAPLVLVEQMTADYNLSARLTTIRNPISSPYNRFYFVEE
jgi:hypothetical protein